MQFSVPIYPNGWQRGDENPPRVCFPNKEFKDAYVEEEIAFCNDHYSAWQAEVNPEKRASARAALDARRVMFAKKKGYQPSRNNPKDWIFKPVSSTVPTPPAVA